MADIRVESIWKKYWKPDPVFTPGLGAEVATLSYRAGARIERLEIDMDKEVLHIFTTRGHEKVPLPLEDL